MQRYSAALDLFLRPAREAMRDVPVLPATAPVKAAVAAMAESAASIVLAVDANGALAGVLTERDVATRVAFRADPNAPVSALMTPAPMTAPPDEPLYRVIALLRRQGFRHVPVVERDGAPLGVIARADALAAVSARLLAELDVLGRLGHGLEDHIAAKRAQAAFARALLDDGLPAPDIQRAISEINRDIHRDLLEASIAAMAAEGKGRPPVDFTLLIMGSGGRGESFLAPDQDNGFLLADYPDDRHTRIDAWFVDLASRFTAALDKAGFTLCKGDVMATNPLWRKTRAQWKEQIALWVRRRSPVALLYADIFFDFAAAWGDPAPALQLRRHVAELLARERGFLHAMLGEDRRLGVALGFFGGLKATGTGEHAGEIDLKINGTMPLVASARLWALAKGVEATGTRERLAALAKLDVVSAAEAGDLGEAFETVTFVLLRGQLTHVANGKPPDNFVRPGEMGKREREKLIGALKSIDRFAARTRAEFTGKLI
jgi:signal-transduction protein with cAMP-binding, CBS, and nucleotidyltransferase domain